MRNPTLMLKHPSATRQRLLALADQIPGAWIGIKIAALLLTLEGQRPGWISQVLGLTRMSLNRWIHVVNEQGIEVLKPRPRSGRPTQLTSHVQKVLEKHLEKVPSDFGLNRSQWDGPTLVAHLKRHFGIRLKVRQAQKWLHQLGYQLKRAGYFYLQAQAGPARKFQKALKKTPPAGAPGGSGLSG